MAAAVVIDRVVDRNAGRVETGFGDQQSRPEIPEIMALDDVVWKHDGRYTGGGHAGAAAVFLEPVHQRSGPVEIVEFGGHDAARNVVDAIEDRLVIMQAGKIAQVGTPT